MQVPQLALAWCRWCEWNNNHHLSEPPLIGIKKRKMFLHDKRLKFMIYVHVLCFA